LTVLEEFTNKPLPPQLEGSLSPDLPSLFETVRSGVLRSAQTYITLCTLIERLIKRSEGIAADNARLSQTLQSLTELSADTYAADRNDVPMLNDGLTATARHISAHQALVLDEARTTDEIVLEDLKTLRDALVSMREMFERHDRLSRNNIPALEKRIASSQQKLASVQAKPDGTKKPGEEEKVKEAIVRDQEDIKQQHARGVFIVECVRDEIGIWMGSMTRVGSWIKMWAGERGKYAELVSEGWRGLGEEVEHMMGSGD
jgi:sorting nexin-8